MHLCSGHGVSTKRIYANDDEERVQFHPRCKKLGVAHVFFADDLLMFCKADIESVILLKQAFQNFSKASGLQANADKSVVYIAGKLAEGGDLTGFGFP